MEAVALIKRICIRPLVSTLPGPEGWVALRERQRLVKFDLVDFDLMAL